jgi:hypothetical protein
VLQEGNGKTQGSWLHDPVFEAVEVDGTFPEKQKRDWFSTHNGSRRGIHASANFETDLESQIRRRNQVGSTLAGAAEPGPL